jgi:ABC-type transport system substrate-binding protein
MRLVKRSKALSLGIALLLLAIILACGSEATPTATPPQVDAGAIQQALEQALASRGEQSTGPSAEEIAQQIEAVMQAAVPEGLSPEEVAQQIEASVQAAMPEGTSAEEIARMVQQAVSSLPTPAAMPAAATTAPTKVELSGSLNVGLSILLGAAEFNLTNQGITQSRFDNVFTHHDMWTSSSDGLNEGRLVREWEVNPTGTIYTFHLQEGAMFSGEWGEFTADDLIFSIEQVSSEESVHSVKGATRATLPVKSVS